MLPQSRTEKGLECNSKAGKVPSFEYMLCHVKTVNLARIQPYREEKILPTACSSFDPLNKGNIYPLVIRKIGGLASRLKIES
jgi:hypothetical protein